MPARTLALVVGVLLTVCAGADAGDLRARYLGGAGLELTDGETTIFVDFPYTAGAYDAPEWPDRSPLPRAGALCLFTHSHLDHVAPDELALAGCTVAGPADVRSLVPESRRLSGAGALRFEGVGIVPVPSDHAGLEHLSYRIEWEGFRMYVTGDTDDARELLAQRDVDVAFVTPWLLSQKRVADRLDAARIVLVHHDEATTAPGCERCFVPKPGQILRLRAGR